MTPRQSNQKRIGSVASERSQKMKRNPTLAEKGFMRVLEEYKIPYRFQKVVFAPRMFYILDFWIKTGKKSSVVVEIDGKTHNEEYDKRRDSEICKQNGYRNCKIVRIKNEQVFNGEAKGIVEIIFGGIISKIHKRERKRLKKRERVLRTEKT